MRNAFTKPKRNLIESPKWATSYAKYEVKQQYDCYFLSCYDMYTPPNQDTIVYYIGYNTSILH